jgi:hypothetical protein
MRTILLGLSVAIAMSIGTMPSMADRAALVPLIFHTCQNTLLDDGKLVTLLIAAALTVDEVCQCQASLFVAGLSDAQIAEITQTPALTTHYTISRFRQAIGLCIQNLMISK